MEISWADRVRNEEVLQRVKEEKNILLTIKRRKAAWIGHILRRNCRLRHVIERKTEGMIEVKGRRGGRKCERILDALKEMKEYGN
jgi:replicative superfamily II helicase